MPKPCTDPTLYDQALQLSITKLKEWGYIEPNRISNSTLTWSKNGRKTGSISIHVNTCNQQAYIELDYNYKDTPRKYKVQLIATPSNLGKGLIWYFLCPITKKRCRKLYSISGYFLHRTAFTGCMYSSQIESKYYRNIEKRFGAMFKEEKLYEQTYSKHFKKFYNGKPTKRYKKIMLELRKAANVNRDEFMRELYKV